MAISWGSWDYGNSSAGFRVGVEVTNTAVNSGSSSVTFTTKWYVEAMYNVNDSMTLTYSGSISGSTTDNLTTGTSGGYKLFATKTYVYTYSTYGSSPGTRTFRADLSGVYNGADPYKSITVTIPARPYAVPAAPTNVAVTRQSDAQNTISWTRNATTAAPYSSLTVQQRKYTGSAWSSWSTIATTSSTATSYVDTGNDANAVYQYQVRANNSSGSSSYVATAEVPNTPAAPTGVVAVKGSTGTTIDLTWANNHYTGKSVGLKIERSVAGGAYAEVTSGLSDTTTTWTDNSPGAGTNEYRVFAYVQTVGSVWLTSAAGQSNTVSTTVAPLAPTLLSPNGGARDLAVNQTISWYHNHGGDHAAQTHYTIEVSSNGGGSWSVLANDIASAVTAHVIPAGTLSNGTTYLWRVKTEGVVSAGYGPFSSSATLIGSATPTLTIGASTPPASVTTLPISLGWTYSQAQSSAQAAWELDVQESGQVRETQSGSGTTNSRVLTYPFEDGHSYTVRVRAQSAAGLWSAWTTKNITVTLASPAHVTTTATYQHETGTTVLGLSASAPAGGEVAAVSATVERRVPGGDWVTIMADVALPNDILDLLPSTRGTTEYRVTAASATPTYRQEAIVEVTPADPLSSDDAHLRQWVLVNYGDAFTNVLRFRSAPDVSVTTSREKVGHRFVGRQQPRLAMGEGRGRVISVGGNLAHQPGRNLALPDGLTDSPPLDWEQAGLEAEIVCYRDFTGRRVFGYLSDVSVSDDNPGVGSVGFTVTEAEYTEVYG